MIYFLGGKLVILYTLGLFTGTLSFTEKVWGVQNGKLVWFLYRHRVFYMYSSLLLQHDPVHPSHRWHQPTLPGPRGAPPPTYTSLHHALLTARPGDAWRLFWEAVSVAPRISVAFRLFRSFRMWYILTLKKNWIFLFIYCTTRAFCVSFCNIFFLHITKVRDYMSFYWDPLL